MIYPVLTYEYECSGCGRVFEIRQRISEPPLERCPDCGGGVRRVLSAAPFILKGAGFYVNDYPSESRKKGLEGEKKAGTDSPTPPAPAEAPSKPTAS